MELHLAHLNWLRTMHGQTGLTSRLNVQRGADFEACVADGTVIASFESIYVVTCENGHWGVKARSSFAP